VSIKNIIPIEDYSAVVAPVIAGLRVTEDMEAFAQGMFQRNNWDDNMAFYPLKKVFFISTTRQPLFSDIAGEEVYEYYSPLFPSNDALKIKSTERKILYLDENYDNDAISSGDYVKIKRVIANKNGGELVDVLKGVGVSKKAYALMKKAGNPMITQVLGYQKVTYPDGTPVTIGVKNYMGQIENKYVYKLINLYGEGAFGSEYYTDFRPSVVDNNTVRIKNEIPNNDIIAALPHVDMIVGADLVARHPGGEGGDHLVGVHVGAGAGTRLKDIDREVPQMSAFDDFPRCRLNGASDGWVEQAQFPVDLSRTLFDQGDGANECRRHGQTADGEVLHRTLGLGGIKRVLGDFQFAHAVLLDTKGGAGHEITSCRNG
jgi:hypothetical protein